jgi:hypothetical protein
MLGPATRQRREIARRQSWFLHSAAPQVVPVVVVRTKRSRLRTRRFAQTAALPSVRTLHAPRAATSAQACRSRRASRPPDSRQPDSFGLATILRARFSEFDIRCEVAPPHRATSMRNPREYANVGGSPCVDCLTACPASYVRLVARSIWPAKPRRDEPQTSASRTHCDSRKKTFFVTRRLAARARFDPVKYASLLRPAASR